MKQDEISEYLCGAVLLCLRFFVYGDVSKHDEITTRLKEKMEKMQLHRLYTNSKEAPTEEEREAAKSEYLEMAGKCRVNTIVDLND